MTVEGNRAEIATNRDCDPKRWNAKGSRAIGSKEEIKVLNTHLDQLQNAIYYAHQRVFDMGLPITADAIKSSYLGTLTNSHTLLEAVADHNLKMEQLVGKDYVRGTLNRYKVLERHLRFLSP
ncbi:Arm DNA-binding domain-containing protein [Pedobacter sp. GR22-10]|uniref:Arm DNA-binding domain-containing protein n=1 Tax=Pedobacter sp. GR22-10 TaxID=2994472 RepID=UPI003A4D3F45